MEAYEVEQDFSGIGRRTMLLNARKVFYEADFHTTILLAIEEGTDLVEHDGGTLRRSAAFCKPSGPGDARG